MTKPASLLHLHYLLLLLIMTLRLSLPAYAGNVVTVTLSDSAVVSSDKLEMVVKDISNYDDKITISFELESSNVPFTIYNALWRNGDTLHKSLVPFSLMVRPEEVTGKKMEWLVTVDFPFSSRFSEEDELILETDKGIVRCSTYGSAWAKKRMDLLVEKYEKRVAVAKSSSRKAWLVVGIILIAVVIVAVVAIVIVRRRFIRKRREIEELSLLITERTNRNLELETKAEELYASRLDTLNMLCNEYFEKGDSDKLKLSLFNEVEKHILALRDAKSIAELEQLVNSHLDNILDRIKEQMPELNRKDLLFLTYLYAGFSPRAVCIFTDIKLKNFYNRRSRLKERILASDAPDREYFASKM